MISRTQYDHAVYPEVGYKMNLRRRLLFQIFVVCHFLILETKAFLSTNFQSQKQLSFCLHPSKKYLWKPNRAIRIWIEDAEDGFVDEEENLEVGEVCVRAVKAFASSVDATIVDSAECSNKKRFLCAGALVRRPSLSSSSLKNKNDGDAIYDAWMADALLDEGGPNLQVQGATRILDDLLLHYLMHHHDNSNPGTSQIIESFVVQCGSPENEFTCASYQAALLRGFRPNHEIRIQANGKSTEDEILLASDDTDGLIMDPTLGYERYSQLLENHNEEESMLRDIASQILKYLPRVRSTSPRDDD